MGEIEYAYENSADDEYTQEELSLQAPWLKASNALIPSVEGYSPESMMRMAAAEFGNDDEYTQEGPTVQAGNGVSMNENEQRELIDDFARLDDRSVEIAKQIVAMANTDEWRLLQALIEQRVREVGDRALDDQESERPKPVGYWRGFRDGASGLRDIFEQMSQAAKRFAAVDRQKFSHPDFGSGGGEPAVGGDL